MKLGWTLFAASLIVPVVSSAKIVDLAFPQDGRFEHAEVVPAGKFLEVCGKLERGDRLPWSFQAAAPLDFNIHYHVADKVEYPERRTGVESLQGTFEAPLAQHFCWMWKNPGKTDVSVSATVGKAEARSGAR